MATLNSSQANLPNASRLEETDSEPICATRILHNVHDAVDCHSIAYTVPEEKGAVGATDNNFQSMGGYPGE